LKKLEANLTEAFDFENLGAEVKLRRLTVCLMEQPH
jgi:hypothetical protein